MVESTSGEAIVALNIKNSRAEALATELASRTGETKTGAVIRALEERLTRLRGTARAGDLVDQIMEIAERCSALPVLDDRSPDEILGYGEDGTFS